MQLRDHDALIKNEGTLAGRRNMQEMPAEPCGLRTGTCHMPGTKHHPGCPLTPMPQCGYPWSFEEWKAHAALDVKAFP